MKFCTCQLVPSPYNLRNCPDQHEENIDTYQQRLKKPIGYSIGSLVGS